MAVSIYRYEISVVTRDEVGAYKPYLWEQSIFAKETTYTHITSDQLMMVNGHFKNHIFQDHDGIA